MPAWDLTQPNLHKLYEPYFKIGNIYASTTRIEASNTTQGYGHHYKAITPENWTKPEHIAGTGVTGLDSPFTRPTADQFNFERADSVVKWAIANGIQLAGHALLWHSQTPPWLFASAPGVPLTRAQALDNLEFYIRTLATHFTAQGTIDAFHSWDVANEVFESGGGDWGAALDDWQGGDWRTQMRGDKSGESGWWHAFANGCDTEAGEHPSDFLWYAFTFARRYFPKAVLYYNDYNEEIPAKRNAIAQMTEQLNARWASHPDYDGRLLVERIGMQSHYHLRGWATDMTNVRAAIERFVATGAGISITELDITVGGFGSPEPAEAELPALLDEQATAYAQLFGYYLTFAQHIHRVTFWGLCDGQSWRSEGYPLIFDSHFAPKPAFDAIVAVVTNWEKGIKPTLATPVSQVAQDVDLRQHMEAVGATVTWQPDTQTSTVVLGKIIHEFVVGTNAELVNGQVIVHLSELNRVFNVHQNGM